MEGSRITAVLLLIFGLVIFLSLLPIMLKYLTLPSYYYTYENETIVQKPLTKELSILPSLSFFIPLIFLFFLIYKVYKVWRG